jgi:hypothetical protein
VGGEPLKEYARRYGVMTRGIEAVKGEIARLESEHPVPGRRSKALLVVSRIHGNDTSRGKGIWRQLDRPATACIEL